MQKGKRFFHILATLLAILPIASCKMDGGDIKTATKEEWQHSESTLIIRTNVSAEEQMTTNARSAVPSKLLDTNGQPLVFAGALYASNTQEKDKAFQKGEYDNGRLTLAFESANEEEKDYTLEIRAYKGGTKPESFKDISPLLSGTVPITISANVSEINAPAVKLKPFEGAIEGGSIKLEILIPSDNMLGIHIGEIYRLIEDSNTQENGYKKCTISESGIKAGIYEVDFLLYNSNKTNVVYLWNEAINIYPGMTTDKWNSGNIKDGARQIDKAKIFSTFYVKGEDPQSEWFKKLAVSASEETGSLSHPYTKIQDAIRRVVEINDESTPFSIYIDGTLTQNENSTTGMADFSALEKNLNLTISSLSETTKATLNAGGLSRIINAKPTSGALKLTLENLDITGGNVSGEGGGISFNSNDGTLEIKNSKISKNTVSSHGGGIHISGSSTFKMNGCTISENIANGTNIGNGAGMYVENGVIATISNTTLSRNEAESNGGAIYARNNCNLTTENCTISGNSAQQNGGGVYVTGSTLEMKGGTIGGTRDDDKNTAKYGGGVYVYNAEFAISGTAKISGNKATSNTDDSSSGGGGVYITGKNSKFTMSDGTITGNTTSENGGGVLYDSGTFEMSGGTISENQAKCGGGIYVTLDPNEFKMTGGEITGNIAEQDGGGVYVDGSSTFEMNSGKITKNKANSGGGVYILNGTFTMDSDSEISENTADSGNGHGAFIQSNCTFKMSGAAKFAESDDVYLYAGDSNVATITVAGALTAASPVATIKLPDTAYTAGKQVLSKGGSVATITQDICDKFALSEASWKIVPDGTGSQGVLRADTNIYVRGTTGATWYASNAPDAANGNDETGNGTKEKPFATIKKAVDTVIAQNDGTSEYTIYLDGTFTARSLAAIADFSSLSKPLSLKILGLDASNKAVLDGKNMASGISVGSGARKDVNLTLENLTVQNAKGNGIALYCEKTNSHTIKNCEIKSGSGGTGIYQVYGSLDLQDCKISGNKTNQKGGAVYSQLGSLTMTDCTVSDNSAMNGLGGGVCSDGASLTMTNCMVTKNNAKEGAGICFFYNSTDSKSLMMIKDCAINENQATSMGGGVYVYYNNSPKNITMEGCTISGNTASGDGGGVYFKLADYASSPVMKDCTVNGNNASNGKGAYLYPYMGMVKLMLDGKTKFAKDDDVYLYAAGSNVATITVAGALTTESPVATITPDSYTAGRQVLSAGTGVTITQGICDKFALSETGWKIAPNGSNGVLEKDEVSTGGGGISVTLPNLGTYTFVVKSNGTQIANNGEIRADSDIILENVTDSKGAEVNGTVTIELQDTSGKILKSNDSNSKTLHVPSYPFELEAQVYVKVVLSDGNIIDTTIPVAIEPQV